MSAEDIKGPSRWKVKKRDGSRLEPANFDVLRHWVETGQVGPDDHVINEDLADWILASEAVEFDDIFRKKIHESARRARPAPGPPPEPKREEDEVKVPDCAFHPGATASEICVGCGKFICEECRQRLERKVYCKRCMAEKKAGVEPGAPLGPALASGGARAAVFSRLAIAGASFSVLAFVAAFLMLVPAPNIWIAPAAGFLSFMAALTGGLAFGRIQQAGDSVRGKGLALAGLISGGVILVATLATATILTMGARGSVTRPTGGSSAPIPRSSARRPGVLSSSPESIKERETAAEQFLDRVADLLNEGELERAIDGCRQILRLYPNTKTAKLVEERLPVLLEELERQKIDDEEVRSRNEEAARDGYEQAMSMYSDGDRAAAVELLRSIVENYPETEAAEDARAGIKAENKRANRENRRKLEAEARELVAKADRLLESERYEEAARLYGEIIRKYEKTSASAAAKLKLDEAEALVNDPSEREFRRIRKELETVTYEESIQKLQGFLRRYPAAGRAAEARELQDEYTQSKRTADTLYNFGRAYFKDGKFEVALGRYKKLLQDYPRSRWASQARREYEEILGKLEQ